LHALPKDPYASLIANQISSQESLSPELVLLTVSISFESRNSPILVVPIVAWQQDHQIFAK
jgi:hypothetical protein